LALDEYFSFYSSGPRTGQRARNFEKRALPGFSAVFTSEVCPAAQPDNFVHGNLSGLTGAMMARDLLSQFPFNFSSSGRVKG
jgi:hypothetical protein